MASMTLPRAGLSLTTAMLLACSSEPREVAEPQPTLPAPASVAAPIAAPTIAPAAVVRTTASVAAPPPVIPTELAGAPKLVYRSLDTGAIAAQSTLVTRTLQRFEDKGLLTVERQISKSSTFEPVVGPFEAPTIRRYLGTAVTTGKTTRFTLEEGGEKIVLECAMGPVQVAAATAVRARSRQSECGDRGKWQPLATKRVEALRCGIDDSPIEPMFPPDRREEMAFTAAPGIEFLFVNDDCVIQGGGYRFVPGGGGVGPIRPPGTL